MQNVKKIPYFSFWGYIEPLVKHKYFVLFENKKSSDSTLILNNQNKNSSHHWVLTLNFVHRFWNMANCDNLMYLEPPEKGLFCHFFTCWKVSKHHSKTKRYSFFLLKCLKMIQIWHTSAENIFSNKLRGYNGYWRNRKMRFPLKI